MNRQEIPQEDTIAAISTPTGEGGIGLVRLSGVDAIKIATKIFRTPDGNAVKSFRPRHVTYGFIVESGEKIDEALLTVMLSPKTYTCEDMVEISCHGGALVTKKNPQNGSGIWRASGRAG